MSHNVTSIETTITVEVDAENQVITLGAPGPQGPAGPQGATGASGTNGENGEDAELAIGFPVTSGTENSVLFIDDDGNLAQSPDITFDGSALMVVGEFVAKDVDSLTSANMYLSNRSGVAFWSTNVDNSDNIQDTDLAAWRLNMGDYKPGGFNRFDLQASSHGSGVWDWTSMITIEGTGDTSLTPNGTGSLTAGAGAFFLEAGAPTDSLFVTSAGSIGVGTNSPAAKIQVGAGIPTEIGTPWDMYTFNDSFGRWGIESGNNNAAMEFIEVGQRTFGIGTIFGDFFFFDNQNGTSRGQILQNGDFALGGATNYNSPTDFTGSYISGTSSGITIPSSLYVTGESVLTGGLTVAGNTGFFGASPVPQGSAIADATNGTDVILRVNDVLALIRSLGFIAT